MSAPLTRADAKFLRDFRRATPAQQARISEMALQGAADGATAHIRGAARRAATRTVVIDLLRDLVPISIIQRVLGALAKPHYVHRDGVWVLRAAGVKVAA